mmetsp:Transcript_115458/g.358716  ORF Transcript_115458/g.358716 Transcript_115458/m.358716 type:complete len:80 (+) Transcript_115458:588-827(+)
MATSSLARGVLARLRRLNLMWQQLVLHLYSSDGLDHHAASLVVVLEAPGRVLTSFSWAVWWCRGAWTLKAGRPAFRTAS